MNFDIKDVKSWATRHEVKVGDLGYFGHSVKNLEYNLDIRCINKIRELSDNYVRCFITDDHTGDHGYGFFLPLNAVKEDKPKEKKYRPFKTMQELAEVSLGNDWEYGISTGSEIVIRRKGDLNRRIIMLVNEIETYETGELIDLGYHTMSYWFEKYEILNYKGDWLPFGVEVEDE